MNSFKINKNANILKKITIPKNFHGRFTAEYREPLNMSITSKKIELEFYTRLFERSDPSSAFQSLRDLNKLRIYFDCSTYHLLKAVCNVTDWPLQSGLNNNGFLCESVYLKQRRANLLDFFYGRRKSEDHQPFKFPILCIVIITQSNV